MDRREMGLAPAPDRAEQRRAEPPRAARSAKSSATPVLTPNTSQSQGFQCFCRSSSPSAAPYGLGGIRQVL